MNVRVVTNHSKLQVGVNFMRGTVLTLASAQPWVRSRAGNMRGGEVRPGREGWGSGGQRVIRRHVDLLPTCNTQQNLRVKRFVCDGEQSY